MSGSTIIAQEAFMKRILTLTLLFASAVSIAWAQMQPGHAHRQQVKNVVFMVPDGMGLADVTAVRILKNGISGDPLWLETLEHIGYQRSYSEKNTVTDSSAAASAWACGEKFVNNEVCLHADGRPHNYSLLELAKLNGMATGLVATQNITHATPAAFGAHVQSRTCEQEIARQYVQLTQPDVMLGGGRSKFISTSPDACLTAGDFAAEAVNLGYSYVTTAATLDLAVQSGARKLLGLFSSSYMTPEVLRPPTTTQPRLPDMASAALSVLDDDRRGFFLLIEGSHIDTCNHVENLPCMYGELVAFDEAVKIVLDWINTSPERRNHTLLIVAPDHETAGFALIGTETPAAEPLGTFTAGWTFPPIDTTNPEAHHTGGDVLIWSQGPGSEALNRAMDNTWVYAVVSAMLEK